MIIVKKNKFGFVAVQKWFPTNIKGIDSILITMYKQVELQIKVSPFFFKEKTYTLHSNINNCDIEEIFSKFSSTIKNEIRRSEKEGNLFTENESAENFLSIFNDFAFHKGLSGQTIDNLNSYGSNLVFTSSSVNEVITSVHSYLIDYETKKVRLLHSATQRFSDTLDKNLIARSNKYLHYMDMKKFKNEGFEVYDWGGIAYGSDDKSLQGINKFKESFGGQLTEQMNLYSIFYYLILKLFK